MIKIRGILLALVVVFSFGAGAAPGASAAAFLLNGISIGGFAEKALVDSVGVHLMVLIDMKGGIFGEEVAVSCKEKDHGYVWNQSSHGFIEENEVAGTECQTTKGTCASEPTVAIKNLPWKGELTSTSNEVLKDEAGKVPGWEVNCSLGVKDTCEAESNISLAAKNLTAAESGNPFANVDLEATQAESEAKPLKCTRGGAKEGLLTGLLLILDPGGDLSIS